MKMSSLLEEREEQELSNLSLKCDSIDEEHPPYDCIIIGGGICGISTAYFLSKRGIKCLVVEKTGIGKSASGKAGGFLAKDWVDNPALLELYSDAFRLHKTLAQELQLTSYRSIQTLQVDANSSLFNNEEATANKSSSWLRSYLSMKLLDAETAQVIPMELLQRLSDEAVQMGARLIVDTVDDLEYNRDIAFSDDMRFVEGVYTRTHGLIHGKKVLLALGPWTGVSCRDWLNINLPMHGTKASSMIYKEGAKNIKKGEEYACFCSRDSNECSLEIYPRPNGDLYVCGLGISKHIMEHELTLGGVHDSPDAVQPSDNHQHILGHQSIISLTQDLDLGCGPDVIQACMMPCTSTGLPVMGKLPRTENVYVCTGHGCWGILCGPFSGLIMSDLIADDTCSRIKLTAFKPTVNC